MTRMANSNSSSNDSGITGDEGDDDPDAAGSADDTVVAFFIFNQCQPIGEDDGIRRQEATTPDGFLMID